MNRTNIKSSLLPFALTLAIGLATSAPVRAEDPHPISVEDEILLSVTAKVTAIDVDKREVTLKGPLGNEVTFTVDKRVQRLNEFLIGDDVTADYYLSVAAELRKPTAEEAKEPLIILDGKARAPKEASPGGGQLRMFKVVATVEGLERPTRMVTLKGPRGKFVSVRAHDPRNLEKLHLGDTIVVTYTEALAVSLAKNVPKIAEK